MKVSATWTPGIASADHMAEAAFRKSDAHGVRLEGGRIGVKIAIAIDMANPAQVVRVSERIAQVKAHLEKTGRVHSFTASMGAVSVEDATFLAATEVEAA
jgi:hypothetical protein